MVRCGNLFRKMVWKNELKVGDIAGSGSECLSKTGMVEQMKTHLTHFRG